MTTVLSLFFLFRCSLSLVSFITIEIRNIISCSTGIDSVVDKQKEEDSSLNQDVLCTACEMAVVWIENQLRENKTKERILAYANEVVCFIDSPMLFEYIVDSFLNT